MYKIGHSFDLHTLVKGDGLTLGGVFIPFDKKLDGHSDADCLIHAITESIIGAMGLGDIGTFFPDTDKKYKNIDSIILLKEISNVMNENKYKINNIDSIIYAQEPKMLDEIPKMKKKISDYLKINSELINIKATTGEKVGIIGKSVAIAAESVVLLIKE